MRREWLVAAFALASLTEMTVMAAHARADNSVKSREDQLKAGYVFNFVKFVEWPAGAAASGITICVAGDDGIFESLSTSINGKQVGQRSVTVRRLGKTEALSDCSVLYIDAKDSERFSNLGQLAEPTLTVSDSDDFMQHGGMIELFSDRNRLRFRINIENAKRAGLAISSNLLQLASTVEKGAAP